MECRAVCHLQIVFESCVPQLRWIAGSLAWGVASLAWPRRDEDPGLSIGTLTELDAGPGVRAVRGLEQWFRNALEQNQGPAAAKEKPLFSELGAGLVTPPAEAPAVQEQLDGEKGGQALDGDAAGAAQSAPQASGQATAVA